MSYDQGFMDKCAQYGINPDELIAFAKSAQSAPKGNRALPAPAPTTSTAAQLRPALRESGLGTGLAGVATNLAKKMPGKPGLGTGLAGVATNLAKKMPGKPGLGTGTGPGTGAAAAAKKVVPAKGK